MTTLLRNLLEVSRHAGGGLLDVVLPPHCAACGALLPEAQTALCCVCRQALLEIAPATCQQCGRPGRVSPCPTCGFSPRPLDWIAPVWVYGGPLADAVIAFKHHGTPLLADFFAGQLARRARQHCAGNDTLLLVPVPLHPRRLARRGFNQSLLLARRLARLLGWRLVADCLVRWRDTPAQAGLSGRQARRQNVKDAFRVTRAQRVAGRRVCLVDDVVTTGATLEACAQQLLDAGATAVAALAVARRQWQSLRSPA